MPYLKEMKNNIKRGFEIILITLFIAIVISIVIITYLLTPK